jgi:hypothetical protein
MQHRDVGRPDASNLVFFSSDLDLLLAEISVIITKNGILCSTKNLGIMALSCTDQSIVDELISQIYELINMIAIKHT